MGRGSSKAGGGGNKATLSSEYSNIQGVTGYSIKTADGNNMEFYFSKQDGQTYYRNTLSEVPEPTPNNMTESQMINRIKQNGATVKKYSDKELQDKEKKRLKDRKETSDFLDAYTARNSGADATNKAYRNSKRAGRIAKRRK